MMRVDFAFGAHDRLSQAVRTTVKQVRRGTRLIVHCTSDDRLNKFDQMLWAIDGPEYIAHDHLAYGPVPGLMVYMSHSQTWELALPYLEQGYWLLNLDDQCPPLPSPAQRILEIVSIDEMEKQLARERWKHYKATGYEIKAYELGQK